MPTFVQHRLAALIRAFPPAITRGAKSIAGMVIAGVVIAWFSGLLNQIVPSTERTGLAVINLLPINHGGSEDHFRFVLCWLENDRDGNDTKIVAQAFSSIQRVTLVRSAQIVEASDAADNWLPAMQTSARAVLKEWKADLAVIGLVKKPGEVLSVWFVPRTGDGTLERGDRPYVLEGVTLGKDFHDDLQAQLTALALAAIAPLTDTAAQGRVLKQELRLATEKLSKLVRNDPGRRPEYQAAMEVELANALVALGRKERSTEFFERAITGYRAALKVFTREHMPVQWSLTLNNLGMALVALGERETGTQRLEEAINAYHAALEEYTRPRAPLDWAMTLNNLGVALVALAERETGTQRLKEAIDAYRAALEERTRERGPLEWAMTQNNLGVALATIGERERSVERLEEAIDAYRSALEVRTRERAPLNWAATQNNLGNAWVRLYRLQGGKEHLDEAITTYRAALEECTRERGPLDWARTQNNLGWALVELGKRDNSGERVKEAVDVSLAVLKVHTRDRFPLDWARGQILLGASLRTLGKQEADPKRLGEAVQRGSVGA